MSSEKFVDFHINQNTITYQFDFNFHCTLENFSFLVYIDGSYINTSIFGIEFPETSNSSFDHEETRYHKYKFFILKTAIIRRGRRGIRMFYKLLKVRYCFLLDCFQSTLNVYILLEANGVSFNHSAGKHGRCFGRLIANPIDFRIHGNL